MPTAKQKPVLQKKRPAPPLLDIRDLSVAFDNRNKRVRVVRNFNLTIKKGDVHGLVGESGCGKSTVAFATLRYLTGKGRVLGGEIIFEGENILKASDAKIQQIRGGDIAMIYQEPLPSLNPSMRVIDQLAEVPLLHRNVTLADARLKAMDMIEQVKIADPKRVSQSYPHQLSGGQQQRVVIGMALLSEPKLLILDEPTTALDVTIQASIIELIRDLARSTNMSMLFISHNMGLIREVCDWATVMYAGRAIEVGPAEKVFRNMRHPYSHGLLASIPEPTRDRWNSTVRAIPGSLPVPGEIKRGCDFAPRCPFVIAEQCSRTSVNMQLVPGGKGHYARCVRLDSITFKKTIQVIKPVVPTNTSVVTQYRNVSKTYTIPGMWPFKRKRHIYANRNIDLKAYHSENLAIVGESGCGKTTLMKMLVGIETVSDGQIMLMGKSVGGIRLSRRKPEQRTALQYIFQNPFDSLNPSLTVGAQIAHIVHTNRQGMSRTDVMKEVHRILRTVKLSPVHAQSYPAQLSGGQKQRVAVARAYALLPKIVIADEPVSALDVSVQAAVMELFLHLQKKHQSTLLLISHDLGVVRYLADRIVVMYLGQIVEEGANAAIFSPPYHPYTEALLAAIPLAQGDIKKRKVLLEGDIPTATIARKGCPFFSRCRYAKPGLCDIIAPPIHRFGDSHQIACHISRDELKDMEPVFSSAA